MASAGLDWGLGGGKRSINQVEPSGCFRGYSAWEGPRHQLLWLQEQMVGEREAVLNPAVAPAQMEVSIGAHSLGLG